MPGVSETELDKAGGSERLPHWEGLGGLRLEGFTHSGKSWGRHLDAIDDLV